MSGPRPGGDARDESPVTHRPLPARPSLEFERKRAKKLLRDMRRANPTAKLSDAQYAAAREYGFLSWPRLVEYFTTLERHEKSGPPPAWYPLEHFERQAERMLQPRANRHELAAQLGTFVPRFYGRSLVEIAAAPITIDDARLLVARSNRIASWDVLVEWITAEAPAHRGWDVYDSLSQDALAAVKADDIVTLGRLIDEHPQLIRPRERLSRIRVDVMHSAVMREAKTRTPESHAVVDYLETRGGDLRSALNRVFQTIIGLGHADDEDRSQEMVEFLISRGADPAHESENGYDVLEHMLARQRTRKEIDLILRHVKPRKAFWIAAALGDARGLARYFDANGKLTEAARKNRPDFTALGPFSMPSLPDADDTELMSEAFYVAFIHERFETLDVLLDHGFPVDYSFWGRTAFSFALNANNAALVEYLLRRGARADLDGATSAQIDQWFFEHDPTDANVRRIYELCGGQNANAVLQRYEARQATPPEYSPQLLKVLELARDDAAALGQREVRDDNLFIALFRDDNALPIGFLTANGVDVARFRKTIEHRLTRGDARSANDLPMSGEAQATLDIAIARRMQKHWRVLNSLDVMFALVRHDAGPIADLVTSVGGNLDRIRESLSTA